MTVALSAILSDSNERVRNSTTGALDNNKRTRAINRVLQDLQDFADWIPTRRTKEFFYIDGVTEYSLENYVGTTCQDNDGSTDIIDFKNPFDLRVPDQILSQPFNFEEPNGVRSRINKKRIINEYGIDEELIIINFPRQTSSQIHNCDSLTANGTVTASGDATNLTIDSVIFSEGSGALNFDVVAGTSLVITFTDIASLDLSELQNKAHLTLKAWLPTIENFTSIKLEWGNDGSANWSKTETQPAGSRTLKTGQNLFAFRWADADENNSPDATAIDFLRVTITFSSAITDTDFRLDDIRIGRETRMELEYYSLAMVQDAAGDHQLEFNPDDVTQTDVLIGGSKLRRTVVEGTAMELFNIIGGKSERDLVNATKKYEDQRVKSMKRVGRRIRRPSTQLNYPGRRGRGRSRSIW